MFQFEPIGILHTCFKEKFGIPRQPGLVPHASGVLKLRDDPFFHTAVRELENFSHIWLIFIFHKHDAKSWKPSIRPPRLGGAKKVGVLASRSPHRPNPIGLSAVKLERIDLQAKGGIEIHLSGVDCLDGTPILDIKPYLSYTDSIPDTKSAWASAPIQLTPVVFSEEARLSIARRDPVRYPNLAQLILELLQLDPRPAFQQTKLPITSPETEGTRYGFRLFEFDIQWQIRNQEFHVLEVNDLPEPESDQLNQSVKKLTLC
jgi:tRNA-Thr(GGU) m(6)t(6)A37 methyltransferase TsaA